jgi:hypothetical protein
LGCGLVGVTTGAASGLPLLLPQEAASAKLKRKQMQKYRSFVRFITALPFLCQ